MRTNLDLVKAIDNCPYMDEDTRRCAEHLKQYYAFKIGGCDAVLGYIPKTIAESFNWPTEHWKINTADQIVTLNVQLDEPPERRTAIVSDAVHKIAHSRNIPMLHDGTDKLLPVYGRRGQRLLEVEQCASALFGIVTYRARLTCYVEDAHGLRIWVSRRSKSSKVYPGMLDSAAYVSLHAGAYPDQAVIEQATRDACFPPEVIQANVQSGGSVSYMHITGSESGKEPGLLQPEVQYVYDAKVDAGVVPKPGKTSIEAFYLLPVDQIQVALRRGEFTPNGSVLLIDFMIRHEIIVPENEPYFMEIISRLHRDFEFPTAEYPLRS